ncbi:MAG: alpha/beta hydrolase, partial [Planctomycetota bacterium]|nr:alpha/beta hydrolase [Planctomycetota bacterium]
MFADRVFYYPDSRDRGSPADDGLVYEDVFFTSENDLRLHGWFMPATGPSPARGTVLHIHGNAANITGHYA